VADGAGETTAQIASARAAPHRHRIGLLLRATVALPERKIDCIERETNSDDSHPVLELEAKNGESVGEKARIHAGSGKLLRRKTGCEFYKL
jgi:hypothetical protein